MEFLENNESPKTQVFDVYPVTDGLVCLQIVAP